MEQNGIDPRFPAIYQAGGEGPPHGGVPDPTPDPVVDPGTVRPPAASGPERQNPGPGPRPPASVLRAADVPARGAAAGGEWPGDGPAVTEPQIPAPAHAPFTEAAAIAWPARRWLIPVVAGLLLAAGVFCLGAQNWIPSSLDMDPSKFHGLNVVPWGQFISMPAPPLLGCGLGILGGLLFLASRRGAEWETALRAAFGLLAAAVGVGGWLALFATQIFPQTIPDYGANNNSVPLQLPLSYLLMPSGTWLLSLALLMVAVLFVVPRRWQRLWPEDGVGGTQEVRAGRVPTGRGPSALLGLLFGAVATAAGVTALFAQYMFPLASGSITVTAPDGTTSVQQDWAGLAPALTTPLMLAGVVVLGWACIWLAVAPGRDSGPAAELDWSGVAPPENWSGTDQ